MKLKVWRNRLIERYINYFNSLSIIINNLFKKNLK